VSHPDGLPDLFINHSLGVCRVVQFVCELRVQFRASGHSTLVVGAIS